MKKMFFVLMIGSFLGAQSQDFKNPFSQKNLPSIQDIRSMIHHQVINRSTMIFDDPTTGRPTKNVEQIWNDNAWENEVMIEYIYSVGKTKRDKIPGLMEQKL